MKKNLIRTATVCLAVLMLCLTVTPFLAETIYYYYGYLYTFINNDMVSLCGLDDGITELKIPATINGRAVVDISNYAFMDDSTITSIDFSEADKLRRIGTFTFKGCSNLTGEVIIPASVELMETAAFQECPLLSGIKFNSQVSKVPNQCCYMCMSLESVTLNDSIKAIGSYAFANCPKLSYVEIPASVESIEATAFDNGITLGVYTDSYAHQYAVENGIDFILLDAPTEPATEPATEAPTELVTEPATDAPTEPVTEAPTASPATPDEPTIAPTEPETLVPTEPVTEASTLPLTYLLGDANGNGEVETNDATIIQRYLIALPVSVSYDILMQGDVDRDEELSIVDATFIQRYDIGIRTPHPIGELITR